MKSFLTLFLLLISFSAHAEGGYVLWKDSGGGPQLYNSDVTFGASIIGSAQNLGFSRVSASNQACNTTCTSACIFGFNQGTLGVVISSIVDCADATADQCICAGPN